MHCNSDNTVEAGIKFETSWAENSCKELGETFNFFLHLSHRNKVKIKFDKVWIKKEENMNMIKVAAERWAIEISVDFNVYTDGSLSNGLFDGVTGVVVTKKKQIHLSS